MREEYDFLIRAGDPGREIGDLVALPLAHIEHIIIAAPRWQSSLLPDVHQTLATVPTLAWGPADAPSFWNLFDAQGRRHQIRLEPRLSVEDMAGLRVATLQGLGLALLPKVMVAQEIAEGRLIPAPFDLRAPDGKIHALHTGKSGMRPLVRHFLDWLVVAYGRHCEKWG